MNKIQARFCGQLEKFELNAEFEIPSTGVTALFGQSGCGKTTVLRCMAGLHQVQDGFFQIQDDVWQDETSFRAAHKREVGYVFQDANLFAHLDVRGNLLFGQKRIKKNVDGPSFDEVVDLLGVGDLLDRLPEKLSGGEKQRVAMGRALLNAPKILLMDEPLSALDRFSKDEIIPYLDKISSIFSIPIVFVSHDTDEVERLADHMIVMEKGQVRASGPLLDILSDPSLFLAKSSKTASVLEATVLSYCEEDYLTELDIKGTRLCLSGHVGQLGQTCRVRIAATDVSLATEKPSRTTILNVLEAEIESIHPLNQGRVNMVLKVGQSKIIARITNRSLKTFGFEVGQQVYAQVKGVSMIERRT